MADQVAVNTFHSGSRLLVPHDSAFPGQVVYRLPLLNTTFRIMFPQLKHRDESKISTGGVYVAPEDIDYGGNTRIIDPYGDESQFDFSNSEIYNMFITTLFLFFLLTTFSLVMFVLIKRQWCRPCSQWLPGRHNQIYMSNNCDFGRIEDVFINSPRTPYNKTMEDIPPPYEDPPEYSTLPKEFILDPKDLTQSLTSLKSTQEAIPAVAVHQQDHVKVDLESQTEDRKIPIAPRRKSRTLSSIEKSLDYSSCPTLHIGGPGGQMVTSSSSPHIKDNCLA